tara:strand:+ start:5547 stop:5774 length:228 start_codon:yes stop_codon:yes gene_type:complete
MIVFEHSTPVNELIDTLIRLNTLENIKTALKNYSGVCWITREEDNLLNEYGFKNNRNGNWEKCYELCGIKPLLIS